MSSAAPTRERILALDVLRGLAVLGIFLMNIQLFSMVDAAYANPTVAVDFSGLNRLLWIVIHLIADSKFYAIFSMLFGAGMVLFAERLEQKGIPPQALHYRRTLWLLVFGLSHAYLLWQGDILTTYALTALILFWCRRWPARRLLTVGIIMLALVSLGFIGLDYGLQFVTPAEQQALAGEWQPTPADISAQIAAYQGAYHEHLAYRVEASRELQSAFLIWSFWRIGGLMLLGMALYKWGVLTAQRSQQFYIRMVLAGFGLGFPLIIMGLWLNFRADWYYDYSQIVGTQWNDWGALGVALGYIALAMLLSQRGGPLLRPLAAVGRMALSNYIGQTLIAVSIFYGFGLGLYGQLDYQRQLLIVLAVWLLQLVVSPLWLRSFAYGPLEWLWRCLTYWRWQPIKQ